MWTSTLKGALGNVKDAWSSIEQSLDAAVGQPTEMEPITIPPPTGSSLVNDSDGRSSKGESMLQSMLDMAPLPSTLSALKPLKSPKGLLGRLLGDDPDDAVVDNERRRESDGEQEGVQAPEASSMGGRSTPVKPPLRPPSSSPSPSSMPTMPATHTSSPEGRARSTSPPLLVDGSSSSSSVSAAAPVAATPTRPDRTVASPSSHVDAIRTATPQQEETGARGGGDDGDDVPVVEQRAAETEAAGTSEGMLPDSSNSTEAEDVGSTSTTSTKAAGEEEGGKEEEGEGEEAQVGLQGQVGSSMEDRSGEEEEEEPEAPTAPPPPPPAPTPPPSQAPDSETVRVLMAEMRAQYEGQVSRLESMLRESEGRCGLLETELRKAKTIYQSDDAKQRQINALIEEGKALAFKQSEMEKAVRKARADYKGVDQERNTLQSEKDALEVKARSLTELIKKKEQENSSLTQSLAAVQAVNQASSDKLAKVEQELARCRDELTSQKAALEKAWNEEKELKRMVTDMTAEHGSLMNQLDGDKALAKGLEGIKQDFEQRESLLQSTNKTLQEALTRAAHEAGLREDAMRQELADMRKRWQDATSRTETLAADMHESTAPLLRQIKALQEEARVRSSAWNSAEEALTERARSAEALARVAEESKASAIRKAEALELKLADLESEIRTLNVRLQETNAALKAAESDGHDAKGRVAALEQEVLETRDWAKKTVKERQALETKLKLQLQDAKDALVVAKGDHDEEKARIMMQLDGLKKDLSEERKRSSSKGSSSLTSSPYNSINAGYPSPRPVVAGGTTNDQMLMMTTQSSILERTIGGASGTQGEHHGSRSLSTSFTFSGENGEVSVLAVEKLQQALRQREEEVSHLQARLLDVEKTRDLLTQEMAALGKKASMLQSSAQAVKALKQQVAELSKKNDVLLELLGEKTEEHEALQEELNNLKAYFRKQLDELLQQQQQQQQQQPHQDPATVAH